MKEYKQTRILKDKRYSDCDDVIHTLQEVILEEDIFYGVRVEAANTLGSYSDKSVYSKSNKAYQALKKCLNDNIFALLPPQVRRAIVGNIGGFEMEESIDRLIQALQDQSYFVKYAAAARNW